MYIYSQLNSIANYIFSLANVSLHLEVTDPPFALPCTSPDSLHFVACGQGKNIFIFYTIRDIFFKPEAG